MNEDKDFLSEQTDEPSPVVEYNPLEDEARCAECGVYVIELGD